MDKKQVTEMQIKIFEKIKVALRKECENNSSLDLDKNTEIEILYGLDFISFANQLTTKMLKAMLETIDKKPLSGQALEDDINDFISNKNEITELTMQARTETNVDKKKELLTIVKNKKNEVRDRIIGIHDVIFEVDNLKEMQGMSTMETQLKINSLMRDIVVEFMKCLAEASYMMIDGMILNLKKTMG